jgi:putative IMPACT (imprinted ancient) family translation regulator
MYSRFLYTIGASDKPAILKANINNIVAVVTRYFGGIKLGAGGLIRAYTNAVSEALKVSNLLRVKEYTHYEIEFDYNLINVLEKYFNQNNIKVLNKDYDLTVKYLFYIDDPNIKETLNNLTLGKIKFINEYLDYIEEKA